MISSEDIAYLAGLFDGEGGIYFAKDQKRKRNTKAKVTVSLMHNVLVWKLP